mgnify:CR=1 FL=1
MSDGTKDILVAAMLPDNPTLSAISQIIGEPLAMQLADKRCGKRVHIPQPQSVARTDLATVIGVEAATELAKIYGGMRFEVPISIGKRCAVARMLQREVDTMDIVGAVFVTRKFVYEVKRQMEEDGIGGLFEIPVNISKNQLSLF